MLISGQKVKVKWCPSNIRWYESKGYHYTKFKDEFEVPLEDVPLRSHIRVKVICDYCGTEFDKDYAAYNKQQQISPNVCCKKCIRQKSSITCQERFGANSPFGCKEIQRKAQNTFIEKYGVAYPLCSCEIQEKARETLQENGLVPTSTQQLAMYDILKDMYDNCELNYPCDRCSLDCAVWAENLAIDFEYDGAHWHQDLQKDRKRDEFVKAQGYKIVRIKGNHQAPNKDNLIEAIEYLKRTGNDYAEIKLDV